MEILKLLDAQKKRLVSNPHGSEVVNCFAMLRFPYLIIVFSTFEDKINIHLTRMSPVAVSANMIHRGLIFESIKNKNSFSKIVQFMFLEFVCV